MILRSFSMTWAAMLDTLMSELIRSGFRSDTFHGSAMPNKPLVPTRNGGAPSLAAQRRRYVP